MSSKFILGDRSLDFDPTPGGYSVEFNPVAGSSRRTLDGTLIDNRIYKGIWSLKGFCSTQFETLKAKLGTQFVFQDEDGKTYTIDMTYFKVEGYPKSYLGEYSLTLEEV